MASSGHSPLVDRQQPSPQDALEIAQKISVLTAIQQDLAAGHLREVFVLSVIASWPTTLQVSWVNGGFAGGAAVVLLSDYSRALVLLAGSRHSSGGGGVVASPPSSSAVVASFRIVGILCASELLAHGWLSTDDLDAARGHMLTTTSGTVGSAPETASVPAATRPGTSGVPRFLPVLLAYTTAAEKVRYVLLERCPPFAVDALFDTVVFHSDVPRTTDHDLDAAPPPPQPPGRRAAIPLGAFSSRAIHPPTSAAAASGSTSQYASSSPGVKAVAPQLFTSLSSFRSAVLVDIRQSVFTFVTAAGGVSRDVAAIASADLALEVLWCLAGCTKVYFSLEATVRAGTLLPAAETTAASAGGSSTAASSSTATSAHSGGGPSGVGGRGNPSTDAAAAGTGGPSASSAATVVDSKERVVVVCWGSLVLLKKKSAFPPPLWCVAFAWYHIERLVVPAQLIATTDNSHRHAHRHMSVLIDATALPATNVPAKDLFVSVCLNPSVATPEWVGEGGGAAKGEAIEEQLVIAFPTVAMLHMFVSACCEAFSDFTGGVTPLSIVPRLSTQQQASLATKQQQQPMPTTPVNFCRIWPNGSDLDAPSRRYPIGVFQGASANHPPSRVQAVQTDNLRSLTALSHFATEHPSVFMLAVQWTMSSGSPALGAAIAAPAQQRVGTCRRRMLKEDGDVQEDGDVPQGKLPEFGADDAVETSFPFASIQTPHTSILSAIASSLALHFAQLPNPLAVVAVPAGGTSSSGASTTATPIPGRLLELFTAALVLNACTRTLRTAQLPLLPVAIQDVIVSRIGQTPTDGVTTDDRRGGSGGASGPPVGAAPPPLPVTFFVCRWTVAIAFRTLIDRLHRQATTGDHALFSGRHSPSRSARSSGSPIIGRPATASPPGSPTTAASAEVSPLTMVMRMLEVLPRDPKVLAEYRPLIQQLVARWAAAANAAAATTPPADGVAQLSVMLLDVVVERALAHVAAASGNTTTTVALLLPLLLSRQNAVGSPNGRGGGGASIAVAQQSVMEWLSYVIKGGGGGGGSAGVARPSVSSSSSSCIAPCEPFSLRSLMQHARMSDDLLFSTAYGVGASSTSPLASSNLVRLTSFRFSAATLASGRASPMRQLQAYFDSGACALWKSMVTTMFYAPIAAGGLERMSLQLSANALGVKSAAALLLKRTAATQTTRTSAQEAKLLEDHLALRSRVVLPVHPSLLAADHAAGGAPPAGSSTSTSRGQQRRGPGEMEQEEEVDNSTGGDDDLETNKALMRRVIALEKKLLNAHNRNALLQEELQQSQATSRAMLVEQAAQWERSLDAHTLRAQNEIALERRLIAIEREASRREALVHSECQAWFQLTSSLLVALMDGTGGGRIDGK